MKVRQLVFVFPQFYLRGRLDSPKRDYSSCFKMQTLSFNNVYLTRNLGKKQCGARIGLMVTGFPLQLYVNMWWMSLRKFPSICRTGLDFDSSRGMNSHSFNTVLSDEVRIMMARLIAERVCLQKNTW